jgi:hypothetical protein
VIWVTRLDARGLIVLHHQTQGVGDEGEYLLHRPALWYQYETLNLAENG